MKKAILNILVGSDLVKMDRDCARFLEEARALSVHIDGNTKYVHVSLKVNGKRKQMMFHRFLLQKLGHNFKLVDHINGDGLDNRISNLREATLRENAFNARKQKNTLSIYKGVTYNKRSNKFQCTFDRKYLGSFDSEIEAAKCYDKHAVAVAGKFAKPNFETSPKKGKS